MLVEEEYRRAVKQTMEKLQVSCLGQNTPLTAILPKHLRELSAKEKAEHIAGELVFALAKTPKGRDATPERLVPRRKTGRCDQSAGSHPLQLHRSF